MPYIGKTTDGFGIRERFTYLASAGATSISGADANGKTLLYEDPEYVDVFLNGIRLKKGTDYNTSTANTIAGLAALALNDEVEVIVQDVFTLADMVSANTGGDFRGNIAIQKDSGVLSFGADKEITVTHSADTGLVFKNTNTGDDNPFTLTLQTGDTDIAANDKLGVINFQAPDEGTGTDAILVAAGIEAVSEGDFAAGVNATKLSFKTATSAAAAETMSLSSAGNLTVSGTFTGGGLMTTGGNIVIPDDGTLGSASDTNAIAISSAGVVTISTNTDSTSSTSGAIIAHSAGFADDVFIGDTLNIAGSNGVTLSQGAISIKNGGTQSYIDFYCESSNAHYARLQAPAHGDFGGNITLTLPATADTIAGIAATQTLTNKTLTTPVIAEITSGSTITLNATTDIVLDADGDEVIFKDGSTNVGHVSMDSDNLTIKSLVSDKDIIFQGNDGGSAITALTLDMSAAGAATFNGAITGGGLLTTGGNIVIPDAGNIGSASDTDAIAISAAGIVTLTQTLVAPGLDISGTVDFDGTTNLDVVDIDGAVDMAAGLTVTGATTISTADNTAQLTLKSTDTDSSSGPILDLVRDSASPADGDAIGQVKFTADNDAGQATSYATISGTLRDASDGTEDAQVQYNAMVGGSSVDFMRYGVGGDAEIGVIFNEGSIDADFRVESNGNANMLFVDGGNDRVGIGTNAPATGNGLVIQNTDGASGLVLHRDFSGSNVSSDTSCNRIEFTLSDSATANQAIALITPLAAVGSGDALGGILRFFTATTAGNTVERMRITKEGYVKAANDGSYRVATGEFHEFVTTDTGDPAAVFQTSTGSYSGGGVQSIAVTAQGTSFNLFEGYTNNAADREFRVQGDGTVHADGAYSSSGGDYAEMFEWKDGNSSSEDRVGKTVVLDGDKIRLSTSDDAQATIIGVVSARPVVLGDAQDEKWKDKFETDSYGRYIREEYTQTEWRENNNVVTYQTDKIPSDVTVPKDAKVTSEFENGDKLTRRKLNSAFDESKTYVSRLKRKEFSAIGLVGKLRVNVGQTVGDRWIKMREISDSVHEYLVR